MVMTSLPLRPFVSILAVLALAGCVRVGEPPKLSFDMPDQFEADKESPQGAADADLSRWWLAFNDDQLNRLIETALQSAPDVRIARARLAENQANASRILRSFDPQGGLAAGGSAQELNQESGDINLPNLPVDVPLVQTGRTYTYSASFGVTWELDLFGRKRAAAVLAGSRMQQAAFELELVRTALAASVADALFRARGLAAEMQEARLTESVESQSLAALDSKIKAGLATDGERVATLMRRNGARARMAGLRGELDSVRRELLVLIGRGTDPLASLDITPDLPLPPEVPQTAPGILLERRPDVHIAQQEMIGALGDQALAKLDLFPNFTLSPGYTFSGQDRQSQGFSTSLWSLGLQGLMPILDRGRLLAEVRASDARVNQAVSNYEKVVQSAYGEADGVLARLAADAEQFRIISESEIQAEQAWRMMEQGLERGLVDPETARNAYRQLRSAREDMILARLQWLRRTVQAFKALGGGWDQRAFANIPGGKPENG